MGNLRHMRRIESAIAEAVAVLPDKRILKHKHSRRCYRVLEPILNSNEYTVLEVKQSHMRAISPMRIIATNERLVIARPSFWNLLIGKNLFSPTRYETIPYNHIVSIKLDTGMYLSSIHMRLDVSTNSEGEIVTSIKNEYAKSMFVFLQKLTENLQDEDKAEIGSADAPTADKTYMNYISMERARRLIKQTNTKFVWLGVEPLFYIVDNLCINEEHVIKINMDEMEKHCKTEPKMFEDCVFVCYNGTLSSHVSKYLMDNYGVKSYVLRGGIEAVSQMASN